MLKLTYNLDFATLEHNGKMIGIATHPSQFDNLEQKAQMQAEAHDESICVVRTVGTWESSKGAENEN